MIKKVINYGFIFCLMVACLFGFSTSKNVKAAIQQPPLQNNIDYTTGTFDSSVSDFSLFNNYDYSYLKNINVDVHLTSANRVSTSISPTTESITTYTSNCFGSLCFNKTIYLIQVYMYYIYSGGNYTIYQDSNTSISTNALTYNSSTCNTINYINNVPTTSNRRLYLLFDNVTYYSQAQSLLEQNIEDQYDFALGYGNSVTNAVTNIYTNIYGKLLSNTYTGLSNSSTSKTSTCNNSTSTQQVCNSDLNTNYDIYLYDKKLGEFNINLPTSYYSGFTMCTINALGTSLTNGYYYSYSLDFSSLSLSEKMNIWNSLTQRNQTNTFEYNTVSLIADSDFLSSGVVASIYLELQFNGNIYYEYNNLYVKFDSNNANKLTYIYYGIFDLFVNNTTDDIYTNYILNENSTINSDRFILINENSLAHMNNYLNLNFNIALLSEAFIDQQIGNANYNDCKWYQFMCHIDNFFNKLIYDIPVLADFYTIFNNLKNTITNVIDLFIDYKEVTFIGSVVIISLLYHFVKRSTE